jgi:LysR family glycine cleavage system transcriptional activator
MSKRIPSLRSLAAFDAAARLGSISRAADDLSLTQSAISQQLLKLEAEIGQNLFLRKGKGVVLTAAGELLYETVRETLVRLDAGLDRLEPYKNTNSVVMECSADFAHGWLVPKLPILKGIYPSSEIWIVTKHDAREIDRVDVDLIISNRPIHNDDIEIVPLTEDNFVAICGLQTHAKIGRIEYPAILSKAPILCLENEHDWGGKLLSTHLKKVQITRGATVDDVRVLIDAVENDLGIAYVSSVVANDAIEKQRVKVLKQIPSQSRNRLWLMRSKLEPRTPLVNNVFEWLKEKAQLSFVRTNSIKSPFL